MAEWRTQNEMCGAELWIELLSFLWKQFKSVGLVISIRRGEKRSRSNWLTVEDPFSLRKNLCKSIQAGNDYNYITDCIMHGYLYFGTIQTSLGLIISRIIITNRLVGNNGMDLMIQILLLVMINKITSSLDPGPWSPGLPRKGLF